MSLMTLYDDDDESSCPVSAEDVAENTEIKTSETFCHDPIASVASSTRSSSARRSSRQANHRLSWLFANRRKAPRNCQSRKGSYLARRIAKNVPTGRLSHGTKREWTLKEKKQLLKALQTVDDPDDYEKVSAHLVTRSAEEVRQFVQGREKHMMKNKSYYLELFGLREPCAPSALSQWEAISAYNSDDTLTKALHEVLKLASLEPLSVAETRIDFTLIYNYLANMVADKELPDLSPLEACLLWDTISEVFNNDSIQSNQECITHLKRQFNMLTSDSDEVKVSMGCYVKLLDAMRSDQSLAYQSAISEGMIKKVSDLNASIPKLTQRHQRAFKSKNGEHITTTEYTKLLECIEQLTGVALKPKRVRSVASAPVLDDALDRQCYATLNPLSIPAKLLLQRQTTENGFSVEEVDNEENVEVGNGSEIELELGSGNEIEDLDEDDENPVELLNV